MLGLVLFGFIWAVGVLDGGTRERAPAPPAGTVEEAATPGSTAAPPDAQASPAEAGNI
jgi:hypothetical protein